jgi:hypothetical protein
MGGTWKLGSFWVCARAMRMQSSGSESSTFSVTARAENRRKGRLSALRAHTKVPYKIDLLWKTLMDTKGA